MSLSLLPIATGVAGVLVGALVIFAFRYTENQQQSIPPQPDPAVPPGADAVLSVLRSSAVLVDDEDRVLKASAPAHALGLLRGDRLVPPDLQELVRRVRRDGEVREDEIVLAAPRSSPRHVAARVAPLSTRLVLVLVEDRTRERRVEAVRRDFVANVSHELKTPVGALNALAEAVGEASDDPQAVERFAGRIQFESQRLARLVQEIIELSRLQDDALVDEPVEVDVAAVVHQALEASTTDADAKQIELAARSENGGPTGRGLYVLGDPEQVRRALGNLVENAVAYSPDGSRVAVTAHRVDDDVHITVTDQGVGIPEAERERIFERFYRVDQARSRSTGGTGLGLSIVKHIAVSHGGSVQVWSEPGQGSSFTLVLPAHTHSDEGVARTGVAAAGRPQARESRGRS